MIPGRCAACKYLRRRCDPDCIFCPYFPPNNPQRFACVHRIFGASNVGKMLQQIPPQERARAADTLYYEARYRIRDPIYGCAGVISLLHQQIQSAEVELARTHAQIAFLNAPFRAPFQANPSPQMYHSHQTMGPAGFHGTMPLDQGGSSSSSAAGPQLGPFNHPSSWYT